MRFCKTPQTRTVSYAYGMLPKTKKIVALCSLANFINAADRIVMPIAIIPMTDHYHWSLYWQGWILSAFAFGYITSQIIGASAASKFGGKTVMTFAVFLWSLSTVITPFIASSLTLLILCRILLGLGEGIVSIVATTTNPHSDKYKDGNAIIEQLTIIQVTVARLASAAKILGLPTVFNIFAHSIPVQERSRAFGYLVASGTAGQTVAALICPHLPWPWMFYTFGSLGIVWVLLWMFFYTEIEYHGYDELPLVFPKVTNINVRWIEFISHWSLWAIYVAHFAMNWSNYIIMQWLPTYLSRNLGADKEDISLTAMPYLINSLCGVVSGHLADAFVLRKWTVLSVRRLMTCIGLIGPGIFLLCFNAVNNLLAAVVFVSISMGLCACNSAGHLSNHADVAPNHAGVTFAISNTIATIPGILCGPVTAELVTQSQGRWFPVFVLAGCVNFVGAVIYASQSSASQAL